MIKLKRLSVATCCILFMSACFSEATKKNDEGFLEDREIYINGQSTVSDLYQVLRDWIKIERGIKEYSTDKKHLTRCNIDGLTMEHMRGIGSYTKEEVEEYHPEFQNIINNQDTVLRTLVTTHPCFLATGRDVSVDRYITWFFYRKDGKYKVLKTATVM